MIEPISNETKYGFNNGSDRAILVQISTFLVVLKMSVANKLRKRKPGSWDATEDQDLRQQPQLVISYQGYTVFRNEDEKQSAARHAVEELYKEITGKDASGDAATKDLLKEVGALSGRPINLVIVRVDPNNVTGSFVEPMKDIDKFLTPSKQRFLQAAMTHLGTLDPERQSNEIKMLGRALVKAHGDGHLKGHEQAFDELRNDPALKRVLNEATTEYLAGSVRNIDRVPEGSRQQLLTNAFSHLEDLKNELAPRDRDMSILSQKSSLNYALGQARYNGYLEKHEEALLKLCPDKPALDSVLSDVSTDFFTGSVRNIDRMPEGRRQQILTDTLIHFSGLNAETHPNEIKKLSDTLAKAHYGGYLHEHESKLADLRENKPALDRALNEGKTNFFAEAMKNLDKVAPDAGRRLITDTITHFKQLEPEIEKTEIYRLSHAFVAARENGLFKERENDVAALRKEMPALDRALSYAEIKYRQNAEAKFKEPSSVPTRARATVADRGPRQEGRC